MMRARCVSAVLALMPSRLPISFIFFPSAISCSTSRSRTLNGSASLAVAERYACTMMRDTPGLM
jgi:hypothetical protein